MALYMSRPPSKRYFIGLKMPRMHIPWLYKERSLHQSSESFHLPSSRTSATPYKFYPPSSNSFKIEIRFHQVFRTMSLSKSLSLIGLIISAAIAVALPSHDASLEKRDEYCEKSPGWASPVHHIGFSDHSIRRCETQFGRDYTPIQRIEVWQSGKHKERIAGT